eukprot:m.88602 g.88602  ORF g.88602 m.88602 type:complete len:502 (+) comp12271_c0_seq1:66-1571(+)
MSYSQKTPLFNIWSRSVAGEGTSVHVESAHSSIPRLKICFDVGQIIGRECSDVFVSHCHMDHIQSIVLHARSTYEQRVRYHIPKGSKRAILNMMRSLEALDDSTVSGFSLIPYEHNKPIRVGQYEVVPVPLLHRVQGTGFAVMTRDKLPLPEEFRGLPGHEIKELKDLGIIKLFSEMKVKLFYSGDCTFTSLLNTPQALQAHTLIMECTYLCQRTFIAENHAQHAHIHIRELAENLEAFENVQHLHLIHFSKRYGKGDIMTLVESTFLDNVLDRISLSLSAFGSNNSDVEWAMHRRFPMLLLQDSLMVCYGAYMFTSNDEEIASRLAKKLAMLRLDECTKAMDFIKLADCEQHHVMNVAADNKETTSSSSTATSINTDDRGHTTQTAHDEQEGFKENATDDHHSVSVFNTSQHYEIEQQAIGCVLFPGASKRKKTINAILYPLGPTAAVFLMATLYPLATQIGLLPQRHPKSARALRLILPVGSVRQLREGKALMSLAHDG